MLRHPVVITSLEEDFEKIGLIKKPLTEGERTMGAKDLPKGQGGETGTGDPGSNTHAEGDAEDMKMGYKVGGDRLTGKHRPPKAKGIDQMEDEDDDDFDPLDEAIAFSESFDEEWESMGPVRELSLDEDDMEEMDDMAEESVELPGGILYGIDEDEDASDDDEDDSDGAYGKMEDIAASMARIESIVESMQTENSAAAAVPAFANLALIAEQLAVFFDSIAEGDEEFEGASQHFAEMAKEAAGIVQVLRTEDEDEIDFELVRATFSERMDSLLNGLEVYSDLTESDDDNEDDDEDEDEGND